MGKRTYCLCGCGELANVGARYVRYHHRRGKSSWLNGRTCSEETRLKMSLAQKRRFKRTGPNKTFGLVPSEETRRKISQANMGHVTPEERKQKISKSLMGHPGYNKGGHISDKQKKALRKAAIKRIRKGIYNNEYGIGGWIFSKKNNKRLHYRSQLERDWYLLLEKLSYVSAYIPEPVAISYMWNGEIHSYIPDLLVKYVNGCCDLIEIKPEFAHKDPKNCAKWEAAKKWCLKRNSRPDRFCVVGYRELKEIA